MFAPTFHTTAAVGRTNLEINRCFLKLDFFEEDNPKSALTVRFPRSLSLTAEFSLSNHAEKMIVSPDFLNELRLMTAEADHAIWASGLV